MVVMPAMLFLPVVLFFIIIGSAGISLDEARQAGWFFEEVRD